MKKCSPQKQRSVLRRMNRFGVTEDSLYQQYLEEYGTINKKRFLASLRQVDKEPDLVTATSLYVHLLDQNQWQWLSKDEVTKAGNDLILLTAGKYQILSPAVATGELAADVRAWSALVVKIVADRVGKVSGSEALSPTVSLPDMQRSADQITEAMLTSINQSDYTRFSANFDQKMKSGLPENQFWLLSQSIKQKLGKYVSQEPITAEEKETFTIISYKVKFEKEKEAITVRTVLRQEDASLLVAGFWIDAPI